MMMKKAKASKNVRCDLLLFLMMSAFPTPDKYRDAIDERNYINPTFLEKSKYNIFTQK